jgi:hypothetical protein
MVIEEAVAKATEAASKAAGSKIGADYGKLGKVVKNPGIKVDWNITSTHGLERMAERGVSQSMVNSWVKNGVALQQSSGNYLFITQEGAAVLSGSGKLITAYSSVYYDSAMQAVVNQLYGG